MMGGFMFVTRLTELAQSCVRTLVPWGMFVALIALIDLADWNEGPTRAAALAVVGGAIAVLARTPLPALPRRAYASLLVPIVAVILHVALALPQLTSPRNRPNDIGTTTQAAVLALQHGQSIYRARIDDQYGPGGGFHYFGGYKYGPIVPRYYFQFMRIFGETRGLYAGNLFLLLVLTATMVVLAARGAGGSAAAALAAALALLWPRFVYFESFVQGVNDLLPTTLAMLGLLACACARPLAAGIALGLSISCKPLPGALLLPLLPWRHSWRWLAAGLALALATLIPDLVKTPRELIASLALFNLSRPSDSTSLVHFLPGWARIVLLLCGLAAIAMVVIEYQKGRPDANRLICAAAGIVTLFLVVSKVIHRNYILWWLPLAAASLAVTSYRELAPKRLGGDEGK
jgi:hypothetical protein